MNFHKANEVDQHPDKKTGHDRSEQEGVLEATECKNLTVWMRNRELEKRDLTQAHTAAQATESNLGPVPPTASLFCLHIYVFCIVLHLLVE